jgi:2-oxopent-4-enoate/cis-2-oxohex-4-enoate hydratase
VRQTLAIGDPVNDVTSDVAEQAGRRLARFGDELYDALRSCRVIDPLTDREPSLTIAEAYQISLRLLQARERDGEKVVGKKIGVTSKAVQDMLNVHQPDFGFLTDRMACSDGEEITVAGNLIQPRAEGEIAFVLGRDLSGPGVTGIDVLRATECVLPCVEIVDSRIRDWRIKIQDTVADNASSGKFVLGGTAVDPRKIDLKLCGLVFEKNGEVAHTGAGAAAMGSPLHTVAWLANTLGRFDSKLLAGEVILSGALTPLVPVTAKDHVRVSVAGMGSVAVRFG